ncbi:MAG: acetyl-CoA synthetase [Acidimicrobiales bacterium]
MPASRTAHVDSRSPCVIGVAQAVSRPADGSAPEPLDSWERVVRAAVADTAATGDVLAAVRSLQVVYCQSWPYDDPAGRLAGRLGIEPPHLFYSGIGGTTPQLLVSDAAEAIVRGDLDVAVVCGAEALDTVRRLKKRGEHPNWSHRDLERKPFPFEAPFHPAEVAHNVFQAYSTFALWDVARRAHLGMTPGEHVGRIGELLAPMTTVAAANPLAWFPIERSARELITPSAENRLVAFPYTKYVISVMDVDLAGAVILASHAAAESLGVPPSQRVYLRGWCYGTDPVYVAEHDPLWASPAMSAASAEALRAACVGIDDVAHLDLYSCFPSSVAFAMDALGLQHDDRRAPFTVTGGLPFFGGAGSDYLTHSIATMVEVLRADPGTLGLCSGVGMHMTKHAFGVYSTEPGSSAPRPKARLAAGGAQRVIAETHEGVVSIATYTVHHGRDGEPTDALLVCDIDSATRCYARSGDVALCRAMEAEEWVGRRVRLVPGPGATNVVRH